MADSGRSNHASAGVCAPAVPRSFQGTDSGRRSNKLLILLCFWWAHKGSNLGPLPCEGNALPLSYAPGSRLDRHGSSRCRCEPDRSRDLRRTAHRCQAMNAARQKFYFSFSEIYGWFVSSRLDERGTFWPVVTGHEAGCDGRKATRVFSRDERRRCGRRSRVVLTPRRWHQVGER
jgi:hypothetical protein